MRRDLFLDFQDGVPDLHSNSTQGFVIGGVPQVGLMISMYGAESDGNPQLRTASCAFSFLRPVLGFSLTIH